jgi:hypothetical protein
MSSDPLNKINGLGTKTQQVLNLHNIMTVSQLAQLTPGQLPVSINNLGTLISRAKSYLTLRKEPIVSTNMLTITSQGAKTELTQTTKPEETHFRALMDSHSWWEQRVVILDPVEPKTLRNAVIYELTIEPGDRIAFICEWCTEDGSNDICNMTYSPQLILHLNPNLPELTCKINPNDWANMTNANVLQNVLWETNTMRTYLNANQLTHANVQKIQ